jgi:4-hydroxy-tetrahydrodipicolinate synthase
MNWQGTFTALVTPFNAEGAVDLAVLDRLIQDQLRAGVQGIVVLGTTGEAPTLSGDERKAILRCAVQSAGGRVLVIAGTGTNATRSTVQNSLEAEDCGVDALLVVTPYYNRPSPDGIAAHYQALSQACKLPVCLYNHNGRTGTNLDLALIRRLAKIPGIEAIKEACGDFEQLQKILFGVPELAVLSGDDGTALAATLMGAQGVISVISNLLPAKISRLIQAARIGATQEVRAGQGELMPILASLALESNPAPITAALCWQGYPVGACRQPLAPLEEVSRQRLIQTLDAHLLAQPLPL